MFLVCYSCSPRNPSRRGPTHKKHGYQVKAHATPSEVKRGDTGESDSQWRFGCYNLDNDGKLIWDDKSWVWIHFDLPEPQLDADISFCRALAATQSVRFRRAPG